MLEIELNHLKKYIMPFPFMYSLIKISFLKILDRTNYCDQCQSLVGGSMTSFLLSFKDEIFESFN